MKKREGRQNREGKENGANSDPKENELAQAKAAHELWEEYYGDGLLG